MFTIDADELCAVREALLGDPANVGVGILHVPTGRVALRPFERLHHRGGHIELADDFGWSPHECLGFIVGRPAGECVTINLSRLNSQTGLVFMPRGTFRNVVRNLRQCWAGMAACASPG